MADEDYNRKLTAILSADVKGYSLLMADDEIATIQTIRSHRELMKSLIEKHKGRVVDSPGDNLLAEFRSVVDAVRCAVEIQKELKIRNDELPEARKMHFRIGINLGDVVEEGNRIYGDGVNIAARLEGIADPGGICISGRVYDQIENKLDQSYTFIGKKKFKNIPKSIRVYRVTLNLDVDSRVHDLSEIEQKYREKLKSRLAEDAAYYVNLLGKTTEMASNQSTMAPRSSRRRRRRAMFEYHEWINYGHDIKKVRIETLAEAVEKYSCIILLGDPGSGKTTALENLTFHFSDRPGILPVFLSLSEVLPGMSIEEFISAALGGSIEAGQWGSKELADHLHEYLEAGLILFLFDALNEMPLEGYHELTSNLRCFIDQWSTQGNRFIVTCRILDYSEELSGLQRIELQPLRDEDIKKFLQNELPEDWQTLWEKLSESSNTHQSLFEIARNPYLLTVIIDVFQEDSQLGRNRADLMRRFILILMEWAKVKCPSDQMLNIDLLYESLSVLAFEMQIRSGFGTKTKTDLIRTVMPHQVQLDPNWPPQPVPPDKVLSVAASAKIIEMPVDRSSVRFYHQLLQEFLAAQQLYKKDPAEIFELWQWPWLESEMPLWIRPENNYEPLPPPPTTGWEETTIMAVGSAPENGHELIQILTKINPVLAGRCLLQERLRIDSFTRQSVIDQLISTIDNTKVALRVRISAGEVLGYLGDPRLEKMVFIPSGNFLMGEDNEQHKLFLPDYHMGKYPVTNVEYKRFIESGGYHDKNLWTEAGWQEVCKKQTEPRFWRDDRFNKPNQPAIGLSWYECVAYCRWLSTESGQQLYRLPTEAEWEKGARGVDGRIYPWGNQFDPSALNAREGNQKVCASTPVGIYQSGASPFGLFDCAGNVWEWCATRWKKPFPYDVDQNEWLADYLEGKNLRALRGGSWNYKADVAHCGYRFRFQPYGWTERGGFRLVSFS